MIEHPIVISKRGWPEPAYVKMEQTWIHGGKVHSFSLDFDLMLPIGVALSDFEFHCNLQKTMGGHCA